MPKTYHTREQELELIAIAQTGFAAEASTEGPTISRLALILAGEAARNELVATNYGFIWRQCCIASKAFKRGEQSEEFLSVATFGYIHAIRKFNPDLGFKLNTYATWWMRQRINRDIIGEKKSKKYKFENAIASYSKESWFFITDRSVVDIAEQNHKDYLIDVVRKAISSMKPRWAEIVTRRMYGETNREIAEALGITYQRVQQIDARARLRVREMLQDNRNLVSA